MKLSLTHYELQFTHLCTSDKAYHVHYDNYLKMENTIHTTIICNTTYQHIDLPWLSVWQFELLQNTV